jgi:hypothetical protein
MIRTFLLDTKLPETLWPELFKTVLYLKNRSLTKALKGSIPYEILYKRRPNFSHLRIIGSALYSHNVESETGLNRLRKLDPKARKIRLVGYGKGANQYRGWNPETNQVEEITFMRADETDTQVT